MHLKSLIQKLVYTFELFSARLHNVAVTLFCSSALILVGVNLYIPTQTSKEELKWPSAATILVAHFTCSLISALVVYKQRKEYDHI